MGGMYLSPIPYYVCSDEAVGPTARSFLIMIRSRANVNMTIEMVIVSNSNVRCRGGYITRNYVH